MTRQRGDRPNVVIFFPDQQRHDTMGLHGNPMGLTPTLDRVAMEGTHCYHGFSPQPLAVYEGNADVRLRLKALPGAEKSRSLRVKVRYQPCNDSVCMPPVDTVLSVPLGAAKK